MPDTRYSRIHRLIREHPWALLPAALELLVEIVELRIAGIEVPKEEIDARVEAARRAPHPVTAPGAIAVIPIFGVISHRMHLLQNVSLSGTSAEAVQLAVQAAMADPNISAIVLDVDSPGGSVFGIEELADTVHAARGSKPVVAVANALAASAAYWIASQADELVVTPSGEVGSIGVLAVHDDVSKMAEREGVKRTFVTAGRYKAEGNSFEPLGDQTRSYLQSRVDDYHDAFIKAVARGRRVSQTTVRDNFGEGRVVGAERAVAAGMADREGTLQEEINRLVARQAKPGRRAEAGADLEQTRRRLAIAEAEGG